MASVARYGDEASTHGSAGPEYRSRAGVDHHAAFRVITGADHDRSLATLIEGEIIPRLLVAHASDVPRPASAISAKVTASEIEAFAPLALQFEAGALLAHIETILARGVTLHAVLVDLLAPTARLLGEYWEEDRCDFVDVTMALWRLQEIVHEIAVRMPTDRRHADGGYRALFASMPGDQHDFGTVVIDELFRRNGWRTDRMNGARTSDLLRRAGEGWFDMIGLTVSCDCHIAKLPSIVVALRNVSRNPNVCIMVGGRIFIADPALAMKIGADGTAYDAELALKTASDLVRAREGRHCSVVEH